MSEKKGRTYSAVKNSTITLGCQFIFLIMSFICRTVFTKTLGAEYLGVSGLFSNILTILSFAELGIGTALVYRMYKPLAENDYKKLKLYVKLYKKIYTIIIIVISIVGIAIASISCDGSKCKRKYHDSLHPISFADNCQLCLCVQKIYSYCRSKKLYCKFIYTGV